MEIPVLAPNDTSFVNIVSTYVLPIVSGINIWVNVINIVILARPIFKGSVYRYLLFNSLFDVFTLSLIALKPTLKTVLTEHVDEDYIYVYLTSCFLMCSDLCTVAALLERTIKLGGRMRRVSAPASSSSIFTGKRHSYQIILFAILVFSALVNSPVLYVHKYFEIEWFYKNVFFELSLTPYGWSQFWAKFIYAISLLINMAIFILTIFLNTSVYKLMKKNAKKLKQFIDTENAKSGAGEYVINIVNDLDDMRDYDDDEMDEIDLDKEVTATGPSVVSKIQQIAKARVRFQSALEMPSGDLNTMESIQSAKHDPIEMESIRRKLCDLVIFNSYIYLVGHIMFILINTLQKTVNLIAGSNYIDSENIVISVFHALSNFTLYSSLGLTFFVHLIYNVKFRYVLTKAWHRLTCCCRRSGKDATASSSSAANKADKNGRTKTQKKEII